MKLFQIVKNFYNNYINLVNKVLNKFPRFLKALIIVFDYGSAFTSKCLFDLQIFIPLLVLIYVIPVIYSDEIVHFMLYLYKNSVSFSTVYQAFLLKLNLPLKLLLLFYILLTELVFLNAFLSRLPSVQVEMKKKYGENILDQRGY